MTLSKGLDQLTESCPKKDTFRFRQKLRHAKNLLQEIPKKCLVNQVYLSFGEDNFVSTFGLLILLWNIENMVDLTVVMVIYCSLNYA